LAFPDQVVSCGAVDRTIGHALTAVDIPGVPAVAKHRVWYSIIPLQANVSAVAPVPSAANVPSAIGVFNISPVPAVFLASLLMLIYRCCW
jgi:hypothetical protein